MTETRGEKNSQRLLLLESKGRIFRSWVCCAMSLEHRKLGFYDGSATGAARALRV